MRQRGIISNIFFFSAPNLFHLRIIFLYTSENSCHPNRRYGYKSVVSSKTILERLYPIFGVFAKCLGAFSKFLGAFAELRKVTISFVVSVRPSHLQVWTELRSIQTCTLDGHLHRVTYTRCRINTIEFS